jgi:hypothetical protein
MYSITRLTMSMTTYRAMATFRMVSGNAGEFDDVGGVEFVYFPKRKNLLDRFMLRLECL